MDASNARRRIERYAIGLIADEVPPLQPAAAPQTVLEYEEANV